MSMNSDFLRDPARFMHSVQISVPGNVAAGSGKYELVAQAANYCILRRSTSWFGGVQAYYLRAAPQSDNMAPLPNDEDIMFTDHLSGCQFLAYGSSRTQVVAEHNNYFGGVGGTYPGRRLAIGGLLGTQFIISVTAGAADNYVAAGNNHTITYDPNGTANVVGVRTNATGWRFYVRFQGMSNNGNVLGPI